MGSSSEVEPLWKAVFADAARPELYASSSPSADGFVPLTKSQLFLRDLDGLSRQQLFATAANNQLALKLAQDEYLQLDKLIKRVEEKDPLPDPRALMDPSRFEDEKEARLYGYKYRPDMPEPYMALDRKKFPGEEQDVRQKNGFPDPWKQGGFVPTESQFKRMKSKSRDPRNIDGWDVIERNGKKLVPRMNRTPPPFIVRKKRKAADIEREELSRPSSASSAESILSPSKVINKRLTRFGGHKHPPTRDVSEAPSAASASRPRRQGTPRADSLPPPPADSGTPTSKRRKANAAPKNTVQAHHAAPAEHEISDNESDNDMLARKWASEKLIDAVKRDHSWLNPDPDTALKWKDKILASKYPVRTLSMFKKWAFWRHNDQDKRPRRGKGEKRSREEKASAAVKGEESDGPRQRASAVRAVQPSRHDRDLSVAGGRAEEEETEDEDEVAIKKQIEGQLGGPITAQGSPEGKRTAGGSSNSSTPSRRSTRFTRRPSK